MRELNDDEIESRKAASGRFGFILGCIAAVLAFGIELFVAPKPLLPMTILTAGLMAALNVPMGIVFGLLGERLSRQKIDDNSSR
jgi:hypothetical protein